MRRVPPNPAAAPAATVAAIEIVGRRFARTVGHREARQVAWAAVLDFQRRRGGETAAPGLVYTISMRAVTDYWRHERRRPDAGGLWPVGSAGEVGQGRGPDDCAAALECARRCSAVEAEYQGAIAEVEIPADVVAVGVVLDLDGAHHGTAADLAADLGTTKADVVRRKVRYRRILERHPVTLATTKTLKARRQALLEEHRS